MPPVTPAGVLIGRDSEIALLAGLIKEVSRGRGSSLVIEQCAVGPTIVVIDDLQWADQTSITLWGRLARSVKQQRLLLIGMMRPVPQRDELLALRRMIGDSARLQLAGLTAETVADLIA